MKKSFFFVLAVLSVAACQKDASVEVDLNSGSAINFSAYISRGLTKAQVADVTTANLDTFRVACYRPNSDTVYFTQEQTASLNSSIYTTTDTYFWPSTGTPSFDFFAYRGTVTSGVSNNAGTATIAYAVKSTADEDLVAAKVMAQTKVTNVPLTFDHILAKIDSLTLAPPASGNGLTANYKYKFTAVSVKTTQNGGTYTFNTDSWSLNGASATYSFPNQSGNFLGNANKPLVTGLFADEMIVMPQQATFSVTYSVEYSADGTTWSEIMSSDTKTANITLVKGHAYSIVLHLPIDSSSTTITFTASVNPWSVDSAEATLN